MEATTTTPENSWLQDAMKKGLILGIIHIFIFLIIYFLFPEKLTGFTYLFIIFVLNLGYVIYQGIQWRNEIGGYMSYGAAFKYAFVLLVINGLTGVIFTAIFLFIDPTLPDAMAESQLNTSKYWAQKMGAPESAIEEMEEKFNPEDVTKRFTFMGQLTGFGLLLIFYAVAGLIIALFVRRNEPEVI